VKVGREREGNRGERDGRRGQGRGEYKRRVERET